MPDYSLGRAHGTIEIDYDGSGADKAARDIDRAAASSDKLDKSLDKTNERLRDARGRFVSTSAETQKFSTNVDDAQQNTERFSESLDKSNDGLRDATERFSEARTETERFSESARDAARAVEELDSSEETYTRRNSSRRHTPIIAPHDNDALEESVGKLRDLRSAIDETDESTHGLAKSLNVLAAAIGLLGPEGRAAALGLERVATVFGIVGDSASQSSDHVRDFVKHVASFEAGFGKISGLALGLPSLAGLAGIGGAAALQGVTEVAGAVRQLSGALGLLPSIVSGVAFSMGTLKIAFHGVGGALKDMMADDPKQFLDDLKHMGPVAAQAMMQVAQFRNLFQLAGASIQDSFFKQIIGDIQPLIQTWLPALTAGMSRVSGIFGQAADMLAKTLMQPQALQAFSMFVNNIANGLRSLMPAINPLVNIFTQLTVVGSGFFAQIGGRITEMLDFFAQVTEKAAQSGALQSWIQSGIDAFSHLINIAYSVGAAFNHIMDIANKFGGGGLLGWLDKLTAELNVWTQSSAGQDALTTFFTAMRQATDAFLPMLKPLIEGLSSLFTAFTQLGVAIAPGWQTFFDTFATTMKQLGPNIVAIAPALNQFLTGMAGAFAQLMANLGPQLPQLFMMLSNAFTALLPQMQPLLQAFVELAENVGPQLPKFFESVTNMITSLLPYLPILIGFVRDFMSVVTGIIQGSSSFTDAITGILTKIGTTLLPTLETLAKNAGKSFLSGLVEGMADASGISAIINTTKGIVGRISNFFQRSPAREGPFSGDGYTKVRGQKMITDMAAGMMSARSSVSDAAQAVMTGASGGLAGIGRGVARGAAGAAGGGAFTGALLPDRIANADTSILDAYLNHQFDDNRGLKGLAKDLNQLTDLGSGFTGLMQQWQQSVLTMLTSGRRESPKAAVPGSPVSPSWNDVLATPAAFMPGAPVTAASSKEDIQRAIITAGQSRGLSTDAIQTALAVAAAESGFNPTISGGVQGSAGLVSGLFQQSPSSGWGTLAQVNDPQHAINAFYDAFAKNLALHPGDPLLAAVLTQNPQLGGGALSSSYAQAVQKQMGLAGNIVSQLGGIQSVIPQVPVPPGLVPSPSGMTRAGPTLPGAVLVPKPFGAVAPNGQIIGANANSLASSLGGANANYTPQALAAAGIAPLFTKSSPGSMAGAPAWVSALAAAFGLTATSHADSTLHGGVGQMGDWAFDFAGSTDNMQKFADFIKTNLASQTLQAIWQNPQTGEQLGIAGGQILGRNQYFTTPGGSFADHTDHVHWATDQPPVMMGADGGLVPVLNTPGAMPDFSIGVRTPGPGNFGSFPTSAENQAVNTKANAPVAPGSSSAASAMMGLGSAGQVITDVFGDIKSGLDALAATQDIADRSVYGMRNTEDVVKVIQDSQKWIEFAANIASTTSAALNMAASLAPSTEFDEGSVKEGLMGASQIASLISGALTGVDQAITLGIQAYHVAGQYVGRFLSYATGFGQGNLMGNVRFLLDENTNRLISYSQDNPLLKFSGAVPGFMNGWVDRPANPQVTPGVGTLNIYAGPGQSTAQMMNDSMWMIRTGGTGAGAASKF